MALILLTTAVADVAGSVDGLTASHTRAGITLSRKSSGRRHRSEKQTIATANFARLIDRWKTFLSDAQRDAWSEFAAGIRAYSTARKTITLSAINVFMRENLARVRAGIPEFDDAPAVARILPTPDIVSNYIAATFYNISSSGQLPGAGEWFIVTISTPHSASAASPRYWARQTTLLTGPLVVTQSVLINQPRSAGQARTAEVRLASGDGLISVPHVFTDTL